MPGNGDPRTGMLFGEGIPILNFTKDPTIYSKRYNMQNTNIQSNENDIRTIAQYTGSRANAVRNFIAANHLDAAKLANDLSNDQKTERKNFASAVVGRARIEYLDHLKTNDFESFTKQIDAMVERLEAEFEIYATAPCLTKGKLNEVIDKVLGVHFDQEIQSNAKPKRYKITLMQLEKLIPKIITNKRAKTKIQNAD